MAATSADLKTAVLLLLLLLTSAAAPLYTAVADRSNALLLLLEVATLLNAPPKGAATAAEPVAAVDEVWPPAARSRMSSLCIIELCKRITIWSLSCGAHKLR